MGDLSTIIVRTGRKNLPIHIDREPLASDEQRMFFRVVSLCSAVPANQSTTLIKGHRSVVVRWDPELSTSIREAKLAMLDDAHHPIVKLVRSIVERCDVGDNNFAATACVHPVECVRSQCRESFFVEGKFAKILWRHEQFP